MSSNYQYSDGELYVQEKVDVVQQASRVSRMVQYAADGFAQSFIRSQLFCFVSSKDQNGSVWTSMLAGKQVGFGEFKSPNQLFFGRDNYHLFKDDILYSNIADNPSVGLLFIDLATRRRHRLNGRFYKEDNGLRLEIEQSFPNCPKFIQLRILDRSHLEPGKNPKIEKGTGNVPDHLKAIIANADTFYVGSSGKNGTLDTSHRGGNSGFVKFVKENVLKIPDYFGNNMFITMGNMHEYPKTGLLFIDDESRSILQLQGEAELTFDDFNSEEEHPTGGTGRYWYFKIRQYHFMQHVLPYSWKLAEYSPFNP